MVARAAWGREVVSSNLATRIYAGVVHRLVRQPSKLDRWVRFPSLAWVTTLLSGCAQKSYQIIARRRSVVGSLRRNTDTLPVRHKSSFLKPEKLRLYQRLARSAPEQNTRKPVQLIQASYYKVLRGQGLRHPSILQQDSSRWTFQQKAPRKLSGLLPAWRNWQRN